MGRLYKAQPTPSGVYIPDHLLVNSAKLQAVEAVWECSKLATEVVGGIVCTAPSQKDFENPDIAAYVEKYFKGKADVPTKDRVRIARLIEYLVGQGSIVPTKSSHGGGPAAVQKLGIRQGVNMNYFKNCAKKMAGVKKEPKAPARARKRAIIPEAASFAASFCCGEKPLQHNGKRKPSKKREEKTKKDCHIFYICLYIFLSLHEEPLTAVQPIGRKGFGIESAKRRFSQWRRNPARVPWSRTGVCLLANAAGNFGVSVRLEIIVS